jgi:hypothetical protein
MTHTTIFLIALLTASPIAAADVPTETCETPNLPPGTLAAINICYSSPMFAEGQVPLSIVTALLRHTAEGLGHTVHEVNVGPCPAAEPLLVCTVRACGVLLCSADDIGRMIVAAEFMRRLVVTYPQALADRRTRTGSSVPTDALVSFVSRTLNPGSDRPTEPLTAWLARELTIPPESVTTSINEVLKWFTTRPADLTLQPFTVTVTMLVLDFIVGHEVFHALNTCKETRPSASEETKLWDFAVDSMSNKELFCPIPYAAEEMRADRCGLRAIRYGNVASKLSSFKENFDKAAAVELAADLIGWELMFHGRPWLIEDPDQFEVLPLKDYLHPVLRHSLIGYEVVSLASTRRPLCDRIARSMTIAIQKEAEHCAEPTKQEVNDRLLDLLPPTLTHAWSTNTWLPDTFSCPLGPPP